MSNQPFDGGSRNNSVKVEAGNVRTGSAMLGPGAGAAGRELSYSWRAAGWGEAVAHRTQQQLDQALPVIS